MPFRPKHPSNAAASPRPSQRFENFCVSIGDDEGRITAIHRFTLTDTESGLFGEDGQSATGETDGRYSTGIVPSNVLRNLIRVRREIIATEEIDPTQIQPSSIDLRLGPLAWHVRASFLPRPQATVREKLESVALHEIDLTHGAVLETGCVYVAALREILQVHRYTAEKVARRDAAGGWTGRHRKQACPVRRSEGEVSAQQVGWRAKRCTGIIDIGERCKLDSLEFRDASFSSV
ncbi:MAG TPA: 2'-deoxycytidine 5'-triphosphate deaminase [Rhizomicrobium sp.]|jgi:hypothetical protein|nr:2'-deoxycytidine 5'-triphosphate deaminase [Rhizomicrobium sp.]